MVLDDWDTGDVIAEIQINNRGIRKGTTSEINAIPSGSREEGIYVYNTTDDIPQVLMDQTNNLTGNLHTLLGADAQEVQVTTTSATQVKDLDFIISDDGSTANMGFSGNKMWVVATMKVSGNTGNLRIRFNVDATDELLLTTTATGYTRVQGLINVGPSGVNLTKTDTTATHVLKAFIDNSNGSSTTFLEHFEVYGL